MTYPRDRLPTRRTVIRLLGGVAGVALWPANFGCGPSEGYSRGSRFVPTPDDPITPVGDFFVNTNFFTPDPPRRYRLHLDGLVDVPMALTLDDLDALPRQTRTLTLECIGNSPGGTLLSSGIFDGVLLADVLALAGLSERARGLMFVGLDGYPAYLPVSVLEQDALLVTHLGSEPITAEHGAPLRVLLPGRYGMFSVKWLDSITATREFATYGSLGQLASFVESRTAIRSRIDTTGSPRAGEPTVVSGLAVTPGTGVARVQVDTGEGWRDAELTFNRLHDPNSPFLWSLWAFRWVPERPGEHTLRVRAFDALGRTQDEEVDFPYDSGALHHVVVRVSG